MTNVKFEYIIDFSWCTEYWFIHNKIAVHNVKILYQKHTKQHCYSDLNYTHNNKWLFECLFCQSFELVQYFIANDTTIFNLIAVINSSLWSVLNTLGSLGTDNSSFKTAFATTNSCIIYANASTVIVKSFWSRSNSKHASLKNVSNLLSLINVNLKISQVY